MIYEIGSEHLNSLEIALPLASLTPSHVRSALQCHAKLAAFSTSLQNLNLSLVSDSEERGHWGITRFVPFDTNFTTTNVKLRLRFDVHLTFFINLSRS